MHPLLLLSIASSCGAVLTPPRGWNAWFAFDTSLNASNIISNAQQIVSLGLASRGYSVVALDGGWQAYSRSPTGEILPNATRFPNGMAPVAAAVGQLGLTFGSYTDRGAGTCDGRPGSAGHESQDVATWLSWGAAVGWVKNDACDSPMSHNAALAVYQKLGLALQASGREVFYSLCGWLPWYGVLGTLPAPGLGSSYRIGPDALSWANVLMNVDAAAAVAPLVTRGHWADVDEIMGPSRGRPISRTQTLTQVALISMIGSPMLLSFDLTGLSPTDPDVAPFLIPEMLAVHDDPAPFWYSRVVGGPVGVDKRPPVTGAACDGSPKVTWEYRPIPGGNSSSGMLVHPSTGQCLGAGPSWAFTTNNAQSVWAVNCSACYNSNCSNLWWTMQPSTAGPPGSITLHSLYNNNGYPNPLSVPGDVLTADPSVPDTLYLEELFTSADPVGLLPRDPISQTWEWDASAGSLRSVAPPPSVSAGCIGAVPRDTTGVWARRLDADGLALLLIHFDDTKGAPPTRVTCDAACFAAAGVPAGVVFSARDVWGQANLPDVNSSVGVSALVDADGACMFLKLTVKPPAREPRPLPPPPPPHPPPSQHAARPPPPAPHKQSRIFDAGGGGFSGP